jgi:hypothetical protein
MPLADEAKKLDQAYKNWIVASEILRSKKIKSKAPEARKALMEMMNLCKTLRKSVQTFKESI